MIIFDSFVHNVHLHVFIYQIRKTKRFISSQQYMVLIVFMKTYSSLSFESATLISFKNRCRSLTVPTFSREWTLQFVQLQGPICQHLLFIHMQRNFRRNKLPSCPIRRSSSENKPFYWPTHCHQTAPEWSLKSAGVYFVL